jgi:hypothetical protein
MEIQTLIAKGASHRNFCEDFLIQAKIAPQWTLAAVSDGCSSGKDSHLASALSCKLLRHAASVSLPGAVGSAEEVLVALLHRWLALLGQTIQSSGLSTDEMLATLLVMLYNADTQTACLLALGDGLIAIDGHIHEIDQHNIPDYPVYHLHETEAQLTQYITSQCRTVRHPQQIHLATDGVLSFSPVQTAGSEEPPPSVAEYLFYDHSFSHTPNSLSRKFNILHKRFQMLPADDVAIVQIRFNPTNRP